MGLYVAKCNLGKVNLKSMRPAVFPTNLHVGYKSACGLAAGVCLALC